MRKEIGIGLLILLVVVLLIVNYFFFSAEEGENSDSSVLIDRVEVDGSNLTVLPFKENGKDEIVIEGLGKGLE